MRATIETMMKDGVSDQEILNALTEAGWSQNAARAGLSSWVRTKHGPVPKPNVLAKNIAQGVGALLLIALVSWQSAALSFAMINAWIVDPSEAGLYAYWRHGLAWPAANLIVLCPVLYLFLRHIRAVPDWARTTGALVVSFILIGDAVTVLHGLLSGGAGARFLLKCLATAVIAGLSYLALRGGRDA